MIGWFRVIDKRDSQTFVECASNAVEGVKGRMYLPPLYRDSVSNLSVNDEVFCVLDDASGFGAILYKKDDGIAKNNSFNLDNDLNVSGDADIKGKLTVDGEIIGSNSNATIVLTGVHTAAIVAAGENAQPVTLNGVYVSMDEV